MTENPTVTIGDDEAVQQTLHQTSIHSAAQQRIRDRLTTWQGALELELQELITQAAETRREINEAKTQTKRKYFDKKFKKVTGEVMQMVATLERLQQQRASVEQDFGPSTEPANDQSPAA